MRPIPKSDSARLKMARTLMQRLTDSYMLAHVGVDGVAPGGTPARIVQDIRAFLRWTNRAGTSGGEGK